jgi:hypothetical protein
MHHELALIDQSELRERQRELDASCEECLARFPLELVNDLAQIPAHGSAFQSTRSSVLDTPYFLAALIVRVKGPIQAGLAPAGTGARNALSILT